MERPSLLPVMRQKWRDLLFLHWQVEPAAVAPLLPASLTVDTFDGRAWVGLVPFRVRGVRPPLLPPSPVGSRFGEVNVRTYARGPDGEPGVWFFSLDASSLLAVTGARLLYALPYRHARVRLVREGDVVDFTSSRRGGDGRCRARWRLGAGLSRAAAGTLDHFLVERYTLYAAGGGHLYRARVRHQPYPLRPAELLSLEEDLVRRAGVEKPAELPLVHASDGVDVDVSAPARLERRARLGGVGKGESSYT